MWSKLIDFLAKPSARAWRIGVSLAGLVSTVTLLARLAATFPPPWLVSLVNLIFLALGVGWALRSGVHGAMRYFTPGSDGRRHRLAIVSALNVLFTALWLAAGMLLQAHPAAVGQFVVMAIVSVFTFVISLCTLAAARAAGVERGSEWVRARVRDAVEPGASTFPGWVIITLIDWRSDERRLSTYVTGTSVLLAVCLALMVPAFARAVTDHDARRNSPQNQVTAGCPDFPPPLLRTYAP